MSLCRIDSCQNKSRTLGLCTKHASRLRLTGTTDPGPRAPAPLEERFWRNTRKGGAGECWLYGQGRAWYKNITTGGKGSPTVAAHTYSYRLHHGPIPKGLFVMHRCDTPACVNPAHLVLGTPLQNTQDMIAKGRKITVAPKGAGNGKAKLTVEKVRFIRSRPDVGHAALGRELGLSPNAIRGVRIGRTWSHVT